MTDPYRRSCSKRFSTPGESRISYNYRMDLAANLHPGAVCVGNGSGAGVSCSEYGALRRNIGGPDGTGDPTLWQRSWRSSGSAPGPLNDIKDTLSDQIMVSNPNRLSLNKGAAMTAFHTRNFNTSVASVNERDISNYFMFPKNWSDGYTGLSSVGGNLPSRTVDGCKTNATYRANAMQPISMGSYGSYGVVG